MARIALDIDSTLHPYWELLEEIALRRFGVSIPYAQQHTWAIPALEGDQLAACIRESHSDENIAAAEPYEGAVDAVNRWHDDGHWIHVTSHRRPETAEATHAWLTEQGFAHHDLHCSFDKVTRCEQLGIDLLIDDSPVNLTAARAAGMAAATIVHPWNRDIVEAGDVIGAPDWPGLVRALDPVLAKLGPSAHPA